MAPETAQANQQLAQVSRDPRWADWLSRIDPATGWRRQQLLDEGIEKSNSVRVSVLVQQFLAARALGTLAFEPYRRQMPTSPKPFYTRAQIKENYSLHRRGQITGAEWNALERDMLLASKEGRVYGAESLIVNP